MAESSSSDSTSVDITFDTDLASPPSAMEVALNIPLITDKILGYLDAHSAKAARGVCSQWNLIILSRTPPIITLNIECMHTAVGEFRQPLLFRKIIAHLPSLYVGFMTIFKTAGNFVENAEFCGDGNVLDHLGLKTALDNFPNLEKLRIHVEQEGGMNWTRIPCVLECLQTKTQLVDLTFNIAVTSDMQPNVYARTLKILQCLINASPNLKRLEIGNNFYPDLTLCTNLSTMTWIGAPFSMSAMGLEESAYYDMTQLYILLTRVSSELTFLRLEIQTSADPTFDLAMDHSQIDLFDLPQMPRLKVFKTESFLFFPFPDPNPLPELETLEISEKLFQNESWTVGQLFEEGFFGQIMMRPGNSKKFANIKRLKINCIRNENVFNWIDKYFSNLQELELEPRCDAVGDEIFQLFFLLNGFVSNILNSKKTGPSSMKLMVSTQQAFCDLFKVLVRRLDSNEIVPINGLKKLHLQVLPTNDAEDAGTDIGDFHDYYFSEKTKSAAYVIFFKNLHDFVLENIKLDIFDPQMKIRKFFSDNCIPVVFR